MTDTAIEQHEADLPDEQREDAVIAALLSGRTVNAVKRQFNLTLDEIDAIAARTWPVDPRARVRMIMMDVGKLDRLIATFFQRALVTHDVTSAAFATVAIKAMERKHQLTGVEAATRIDLQVINTVPQVRSHQRVKEAIYSLARPNGQQPNGDALEEPDPSHGGNGSAEPAESH